MAVVLLLWLQAIAGPPVPKDLRKPVPRSTTPCPATSDGGEIVVCARPTDQRLAPLPEPIAAAPADRTTFRLPGGGTGNVHAIQTQLPGGIGQGGAVMLNIPLGRRKAAGDDPADR